MRKLAIACGIFKKEIEELIKKEDLDIEFIFQDSNLHMKPKELEEKLEKNSKDNINRDKIYVYGSCSANIDKLEKKYNVNRTSGINCVEIFLGKEKYRKLRKECMPFFILPEWLERWEELFKGDLGLKGKLAKEFMSEIHKKIIYIDTAGVYPINKKELKRFSNYCGLPYEILRIDLKELLKNIKKSAFKSS